MSLAAVPITMKQEEIDEEEAFLLSARQSLYLPSFGKDELYGVYRELLHGCIIGDVKNALEHFCETHVPKQFEAHYWCSSTSPHLVLLTQVVDVCSTTLVATLLMDSKQFAVSLLDIYPLAILPTVVNAVEYLRFFYRNLWSEEDDNDQSSHLFIDTRLFQRMEDYFASLSFHHLPSQLASGTGTGTGTGELKQEISPVSNESNGNHRRKRSRGEFSSSSSETSFSSSSESEEPEAKLKRSERAPNPEFLADARNWLTPHLQTLTNLPPLKLSVSNVPMVLIQDLFLNRQSCVILEPEPKKRHRKGARYIFVITDHRDIELVFGSENLTNTSINVGKVSKEGVATRKTHIAPVKFIYGQRNKKLEIKFGAEVVVEYFAGDDYVAEQNGASSGSTPTMLFKEPTVFKTSLFSEIEFRNLSEEAKQLLHRNDLFQYVK